MDLGTRDGTTGPDMEASLEKFLEWYTRNFFTYVCQHTRTDSNKLTYKIARLNNVTVPVIDKLKKTFDYYDEDGSGEIDYSEFLAMLCVVLSCKDSTDVSEERIRRFWKEIDEDGSGAVNFEEFCKWYLKYFNPEKDADKGGSGPIGQFYASFDCQQATAKNLPRHRRPLSSAQTRRRRQF